METLLMALLFIAIIAGIFFATRKKPGRRHDKQPPGRAEADIDNWHWTG